MSQADDIAIVGGGIGGLVLALELDRVGIPCRVYEAAETIQPLGVGINILPHASEVLCGLGLEEPLTAVAVLTEESVFFNRFGQLIYAEPAGRLGGYEFPQFSVHRGDLQQVLLDTVVARLGAGAVVTDHRCVGVDQDERGVSLRFRSTSTDEPLPPARAAAAVACDGIHSAVRKQLHPHEGAPRYSGVMMWRGTTVHAPFLSGASMARAGWLDRGKLVVYPIRRDVDGQGGMLINWVAEIEGPQRAPRDWTRRGDFADFIGGYSDWHFDWLDVPELLRSTETVLEYPMVDQDPLDRWTFGRITLLGDAAHPMVPRGSNGAGQAVLDARALAELLRAEPDAESAFRAYEAKRLPATAAVVRMNRTEPPDTILGEVARRTGDRPFDDIADVISTDELQAIMQRYKNVAGYSHDSLGRRA